MSGPNDVFAEPDEWWRTFEVNVLGVFLCCRAVAPGMIERGGGRIVNVASGSAYLPTQPANMNANTAYPRSKAAVHRFSEVLAVELGAEQRVRLLDQPRAGEDGDDELASPTTLPWTPPECAPTLVHALATGEFDALAGRYLHAEHDPPDQLRARIAADPGRRSQRDSPATVSLRLIG